LQIRLPGDNSS
jgi:hypothetical protein